MIQSSFIFLDRVGHKIEKNIWNQGINFWSDFLEKRRIEGISTLRKGFYDRSIKKALTALHDYNSSYFRNLLPNVEQWRLYDYFKDEAVFLDIETSNYYGNITVIGLYDGYETKTMVKGLNLDKELLKKELSKYKLIITFNGSSFDLPIIRKYFGVNFDIPHIDLRHVCSRIGLNGGLKLIEKMLDIKRRAEVQDLAGEDAITLWYNYQNTGNSDYLDKLTMYNEEDIINLKPIADYAISELWKRIKINNDDKEQSL